MSERSTNPVTETETSNLKRENPIIIEESNSESKKQKTEAEVLTSKESKRNDSGTEEKKQKQQQIAAGKEFKIEANAAEDKGSRHSMEDAWVVLLDASLDSPPGKLRFFRVFFFIFCF
jgi:integrin-linked kinase-associated serine/threonine phosphatase 2C